MVQSDPSLRLPTSDELPCSDDTPVDNEDQNFVPNLLLFILEVIWADRIDWYWGVDMGIYHTTGGSPLVPVIPDGFLSLGVERRKNNQSRKSYVLWEEEYISPILALELVSLTYGGEYDSKMEIYARLGVQYYIIYNPIYWRRDQHLPLEVYRLVDGVYRLQIGEPFWMSEIGLGIGRGLYHSGPVQREVLYWYDPLGHRYPTPEERVQQAELEAEQARTQAEQAKTQAEQLQQQLERYRQRFGELS